jgi:hypothetical protein
MRVVENAVEREEKRDPSLIADNSGSRGDIFRVEKKTKIKVD